nr:MAG TPA: hypothetical protein [Caudoviricetes sp.]
MDSHQRLNASLRLHEPCRVRLKTGIIIVNLKRVNDAAIAVLNSGNLRIQSSGQSRVSGILHEYNSIGERRGRNGFPHIVPVVPVHTGADVILSEFVVVIVDLKPFLVQKYGLDIGHQRQLVGGNGFNHVTVGGNVRKALIVERCEIINQLEPADEISLVHVERTSQHIHIIPRVERAVHEDVLVSFLRVGSNTGGVVFVAHESELVGRATESNSGVLDVSRIECDRVHLAVRDSLDNQVLKQQVLVVLSGLIQTDHNLGNQILHTVHAHERLTQVLVLNGDRVLHTPIHGVESRPNIWECSLQLTGFCLFSRKLTSLGDTDEHFLDSLAKLQIALLEFSIVVVERSALDAHSGDTINQSVDKLVSHSGVAIQRLTNTGNVGSLSNRRDKRLILSTRVCANGVENINGACVQIADCNSFCHCLILLKKCIIGERFDINIIAPHVIVIAGRKESVAVFLSPICIVFFVLLFPVLVAVVFHAVKCIAHVLNQRNSFIALVITNSGANGSKQFFCGFYCHVVLLS